MLLKGSGEAGTKPNHCIFMYIFNRAIYGVVILRNSICKQHGWHQTHIYCALVNKEKHLSKQHPL